MQINWQEVKRLLVVFVGDVETVTFLQPALPRIRETLADTEIALLTSAEEIRALLPWVNRVIPYTPAWQDAAREKELVEKLRQLAFDAAIIFTGKAESPYPVAYLAYLAGIPIRVGRSREFGGGVLSHWIKPPLDDLPDHLHLHLLDAAGFPIARSPVPNF